MSRLLSRPRARGWLLPLLLGALLPGCKERERPRLTQQQFVDVYLQLIQARIDAAGDSTAYAAKRDRVFQDARVKPDDLREFVAAGGDDPLALRDAWQSVAARLDTLYGGVTSRPPAGMREALRSAVDTTGSADSTRPVKPRVIVPSGMRPERRFPAPVHADSLGRAPRAVPDSASAPAPRPTPSPPAAGTRP
ncbi:MAG TPA: hypothetical protein VIC59_12745 [Gemmatimonadota bacterium]|jgi:hypothetical protein